MEFVRELMTFNLHNGLYAVKELILLTNIRKNIFFFINRFIIGSIILAYLLYRNIKPDFYPWELLLRHIVLLIIIIFIMLLIHLILYIKKIFFKNKIFEVIELRLISFTSDMMAVILSSFTILVPTLLYGIIIGNWQMISMVYFILLLLDKLEEVKNNFNKFYR